MTAVVRNLLVAAVRGTRKPLLIGRDASGTPCYLCAPPYRPVPAGARAITLTQYLEDRFDPSRKARSGK